MPGKLHRFGVLSAVVATSVLAGACRQDMHDNPRHEPLEASTFFADGRALRMPVEHTVARGSLRTDEHLYTGRIGGQLADTLPVAATPELLVRGRERFNAFCSHCHGRTGRGDGMVVQRGFRQPPTFHDDRLRAAPVGYFFDVITHGFGAMQDHAAQVPVPDRWAIAAYIRALQISQHASVEDVPADKRAALDAPARPEGGASEHGNAASGQGSHGTEGH